MIAMLKSRNELFLAEVEKYQKGYKIRTKAIKGKDGRPIAFTTSIKLQLPLKSWQKIYAKNFNGIESFDIEGYNAWLLEKKLAKHITEEFSKLSIAEVKKIFNRIRNK